MSRIEISLALLLHGRTIPLAETADCGFSLLEFYAIARTPMDCEGSVCDNGWAFAPAR
jgi:hypothetical protein